MSDSDEYAVSRILESLKGDQSLSNDTKKPVIFEELNLDDVMKMASNISQHRRKSLEVQFKLFKKTQSDIHTADQPKVKRQITSIKTEKEVDSSSNLKKFKSLRPADQPKVKKQKVSAKTEKEVGSLSNLKKFKLFKPASQPKMKQQKISDKTKNEISSSNFKKFKSLRLRNPPKPFYNGIKCLSSMQKKKVIDMGFGSLLEFNCSGIPSKLGHFVADKFDAKSMKLKLENGDIQITPRLIQHILGIPCGGTPVLSLAVKDMKKECYVNWRSQFVKELRPSDIVRKIEETEDDGIIFVLNFIILFLNSMVDCIPSGRCKADVLERLDEDVDLKSVDWCGYIYDCLKKCKLGWKRDDIGSFFTGPLTVLILIYLDVTSYKQLETPINIPTIKFWSVEMMKKREILEMESGHFGCCEIKNVSERIVAQEESEVMKVLKDIDSKLSSFLDAKIELELLFFSAFQKFPDCQLLIRKKNLFYSILTNNYSKDGTTAVAGPSSKKDDQRDFANLEP